MKYATTVQWTQVGCLMLCWYPGDTHELLSKLTATTLQPITNQHRCTRHQDIKNTYPATTAGMLDERSQGHTRLLTADWSVNLFCQTQRLFSGRISQDDPVELLL